jgi:thioredoxin-like negative regulator of GroEL
MWFVEYYVPSCRNCKRLQADWESLAEAFAEDPSVIIAKLNCEQMEAFCEKQDVHKTPTLVLYFQDEPALHYKADVYHVDMMLPFLQKRKALLMGQEACTKVDEETLSEAEGDSEEV